jgi:hypothetical protein
LRIIGSYIRSWEKPGDLPRVIEILLNEFKNTYVVESWLIDYFKKEKHGELGGS